MLRASDLLLTLAAIFLLIASLDVRSRVIRASANELVSGANNDRKSEAHIDLLMHKIKSNLLLRKKSNNNLIAANNSTPIFNHQKPGEDQDQNKNNIQNSYNYFANQQEPNSQQASQHLQAVSSNERYPTNNQDANRSANQKAHQEAQEVRVEFLRSAAQPEAGNVANNSNNNNNNSTYLYLLNYSPLKFGPVLAANEEANEIDVGEQQQQPPFTMFPPYNQQQQQQQQQQLANQLGQFGAQNPNQLTQNNIRQILSNYQRNPQLQNAQIQRLIQQHQAAGGNLGSPQNQDLLRSFLQAQQQQQGNAHQQTPVIPSRPTPAITASQPYQPQQPMSPLQLITAPFQALMPNLGQPPANPLPGSNAGQPSGSAGAAAAAGNSNQQPALGGLFNPFAAAGNGQQQQQQPLPGLHALYQQLPLYQALLAARQRQEALAAAQKLRQQQQQQNGQHPQGHRNNNNSKQSPGITHLRQQPQVGPLGLQPVQPQNPLWPNNNHQSQQQQQQQQQPQADKNNQFGYNQPQSPYLQTNSQPNQQGQVQFDDDNSINNNNNNNNNVNSNSNDNTSNNNNNIGLQNGQQQANNNDGGAKNQAQDEQNEQNNEQQSDNNGNNNNSNSNDNTETGNDQANENQGGGQDGQDNSAGKAEEEDPDLKQFQNLANGGDSFTDLFPPGILSNNDISDIKKQQDEQAKKQADEERRKQQRPQVQNENSAPERPQQFEQPVNQFVNNNNNQDQQQQQQQQPDSPNSQPESDNSGANEENGGDGEANEEQPGEGGAPENESGGGGEDGSGEQENPTAAALTSKSSNSNTVGASQLGAESQQQPPERLTKSPGVEYANS